jgi:hypothetical protein
MPFQIRNTDSAMQNYIMEIGGKKKEERGRKEKMGSKRVK